MQNENFTDKRRGSPNPKEHEAIDTEHKTLALRHGRKGEVSAQSRKYSSVSTAEQSRPRSLNFL